MAYARQRDAHLQAARDDSCDASRSAKTFGPRLKAFPPARAAEISWDDPDPPRQCRQAASNSALASREKCAAAPRMADRRLRRRWAPCRAQTAAPNAQRGWARRTQPAEGCPR